MRSDKLFKEYYEPKLTQHNVNNVVLRTYEHLSGQNLDDPKKETELVFSLREEVDTRLDKIFSEYENKKGIAISSIVGVGTEQKYLLLLDCGLNISDENQKSIIENLKNISKVSPEFTDSMILKTKNSYHIVCFTPLTKEKWVELMGQSLLLRNTDNEFVVDVRYAGHSLVRGYGSLRINDYEDKETPDFVCYLN
jgi:hypothetical protein